MIQTYKQLNTETSNKLLFSLIATRYAIVVYLSYNSGILKNIEKYFIGNKNGFYSETLK